MTRVRHFAGFVALATAALLAGCGSSAHRSVGSSELPASLSVRVPNWGGKAFACTDETHVGHSPPVTWSPGPAGTSGYAITITDPDAQGFVHWVLLDLPPSTRSLPEGISPAGALPAGARELDNGFGKPGYGGPCPPPGSRHHYVLTVWAVKDHPDSIAEIQHDAVASGAVTATYSR